jgi:putative ABC transport system permease protein
MTVLTRAWTAVTRRLTRSLIILAVMALIFTLLISTVAVRQTMANLRLNVERNIRAGFSLSGVQPGSVHK